MLRAGNDIGAVSFLLQDDPLVMMVNFAIHLTRIVHNFGSCVRSCCFLSDISPTHVGFALMRATKSDEY